MKIGKVVKTELVVVVMLVVVVVVVVVVTMSVMNGQPLVGTNGNSIIPACDNFNSEWMFGETVVDFICR